MVWIFTFVLLLCQCCVWSDSWANYSYEPVLSKDHSKNLTSWRVMSLHWMNWIQSNQLLIQHLAHLQNCKLLLLSVMSMVKCSEICVLNGHETLRYYNLIVWNWILWHFPTSVINHIKIYLYFLSIIYIYYNYVEYILFILSIVLEAQSKGEIKQTVTD